MRWIDGVQFFVLRFQGRSCVTMHRGRMDSDACARGYRDRARRARRTRRGRPMRRGEFEGRRTHTLSSILSIWALRHRDMFDVDGDATFSHSHCRGGRRRAPAAGVGIDEPDRQITRTTHPRTAYLCSPPPAYTAPRYLCVGEGRKQGRTAPGTGHGERGRRRLARTARGDPRGDAHHNLRRGACERGGAAAAAATFSPQRLAQQRRRCQARSAHGTPC
eukprot:COSAG02_NODE_327_length_24561_cov_92.867754_6_plen_219_part_00